MHEKLGNPAFGQVRSLVTAALALTRPDVAIFVKTQVMQRSIRQLTGKPLFRRGVMTRDEYQTFLLLAQGLFAVMQDTWRWNLHDLWDVQGFLWATRDPDMLNETDETEDPTMSAPATSPHPAPLPPTNLIFYGPPGCGKTYATAAKAVEICDGALPSGGRDALMARYRELVACKRIGFVTFHQSYAYEDFVEGLRPDPGADADQEADAAETVSNTAVSGGAAGGLSLRVQPGIFRTIATLAENNHGRVASTESLDQTRQVFKMSLGRSGSEEGARLFNAAIADGYVALGWGGEVDWSRPDYANPAAIKARWRQDHPTATPSDPNITQITTFRSVMQTGDLVIVSDGNRLFRAIGQITGPYAFVPGPERDYNHRRPVRWLWQAKTSLPRELIYNRSLSQISVYQLDSQEIQWPALQQIVSGGGDSANRPKGTPAPYVLIIDEINRANISRVFGELITLLEPDKRLLAENELKVTLPYSGESFGVPANLHILGTMNTADRSIALLDIALRRRFDFEELMPQPALLDTASAAITLAHANDDGATLDLAAVLSGINSRIEYLFDREHQLGHAFFMHCRSLADLNRAMRHKVIPLLAEYFYEDWEKVRLVLNERTDAGVFVCRTPLQPPRGLGGDVFGDGEVRWRYTVRQTDWHIADYAQLSA